MLEDGCILKYVYSLCSLYTSLFRKLPPLSDIFVFPLYYCSLSLMTKLLDLAKHFIKKYIN